MKGFFRAAILATLVPVLGGCVDPKQGEETESPSAGLANKPMVIAHRGASAEAIEHTFAAYDLALTYGNKNIEQDLVSSKEGTLFVSHDTNAKRLTGVDQEFAQMADEQIRALRVANGEPIRSLAQVFERYRGRGYFVIETKVRNDVAELARLMTEYNIVNDVLFQSFNEEDVSAMKAELPEVPSMFLVEDMQALQRGVASSPAGVICVDKKLLGDATVVKRIRESGKKAFAYTLDTDDEFIQAKNLGLDGFFTNRTKEALAFVSKNWS